MVNIKNNGSYLYFIQWLVHELVRGGPGNYCPSGSPHLVLSRSVGMRCHQVQSIDLVRRCLEIPSNPRG